MYRHGYYILLLSILLTPVSYAGFGIETEDTEEVFLTFRYRQIINTYITGLYHENTVYIPIGEIFYTLQINHTLDISSGKIRGFFLSEENRYILDFQNLSAQLSGRSFDIDSTDFIRSEYEIYVKPEILYDIFELQFTPHLTNLSLQLFTGHTLPVVERHQRRLQNRVAERYIILQPHAPLKYGRNRSWLNGGVIDYRLMTVQSLDGRQQYTYGFKSGIEIAGGDFHVSTFGGYTSGLSHSNTTRYRWRYALDENYYLTQVSLGEVFTDGIVNTSLYGIQLTNRPIEPLRLYTTYTYIDKTDPGWEVELYINDRLFDVTTADETGKYRFEIPLVYGSSRFEIRSYGPGGGYAAERRRIEIPYTFLPPGDVHYSFNLGRTYYTDNNVVQTRTHAGITTWLSASAGIEHNENIFGDRTVGFGTLTFRPALRYLIDLEVAPSLYFRSSADIVTGMRSRIGLGFTEYTGTVHRYNISRLQRQVDIQGAFPVSIASQEFFLRMRGSYQEYETRSGLRSSIDAVTAVRGVIVSSGIHSYYQSSQFMNRLQTDISAGIQYRFHNRHILRNAIVRSRMYYNLQSGTFKNVSVAVSRSVARGGRIEAQYNWNGNIRAHSINIRMNFDFHAFRSISSAWRNPNQSAFSQQVLGSIAFDSQHREFLFNNFAMSGGGMASIRFFIDEDGSGTYNEGEMVVSNVPVQFRQAVGRKQNGEGLTRAYRLQPYVRYSIDIREDKVPNPLLVPVFNSFSFIADPHSFKQIDVPLQVTGEISGHVIRHTPNGNGNANGLRLLIRNTETGQEESVRTFSDGSFFHTGLLPATYSISIDTSQINGLDLIAEPERYVVTITPSLYGDYVDNLNFELREKSGTSEPDAKTLTGDYIDKYFKPEPEHCVYVVRKYPLESLWVIAECMYGTSFLWPKIWLSNYKNIKHPDLIYPDQIFTIPPKSPLTEKERSLRDRYYIAYR